MVLLDELIHEFKSLTTVQDHSQILPDSPAYRYLFVHVLSFMLGIAGIGILNENLSFQTLDGK